MGTLIRAFNDQGIDQFRTYLEQIENDIIRDIPDDLVDNPELSDVIPGDVEIELLNFASKLDAAQYLLPKIRELNLADKFYNSGLWAWLSAYYFESVCPREPDGRRLPGSIYRHIPDKKPDWRHYYRHLLAFPVRIYASHEDIPKILLSGPLHRMGDYVEQLASRQDFAMSRGILEAANMLYWDTKAKRPKVGAASNSRKPGTLRRFIDVIYQIDPTYDLQGMSGQQIVQLLPNEFARWR